MQFDNFCEKITVHETFLIEVGQTS